MSLSPHTKIAVLGLSYPFRGGISHYSTLLVRELRRQYDVSFITLSRQYPSFLFPGRTQYDDSSHKLMEANEAIIDSINPLTWVKTAFMLKKRNIEVVVVQWWNPFFGLAFGTIANLLTLVSNAKVCFICHNVIPHEASLLDKLLLRYAFLRTRHFIVHSEEDKNNLRMIKPHAHVKKSFHPRYSVFGEFYEKEKAREKLALPHVGKVILFFGLVREYKGLKYLIHAMKRVLESIDCTLWIVGEFYKPKEEYTSLINELCLDERVVVVDKYVRNEDVSIYFCGCDVVVLPYVTATQSGIVQIAFTLNKPVITTNVGGLPEAVVDGKTGFIVPPESAEELADAIRKYYSGDYEDRFSEEIKKETRRYGWEVQAQAVTSIFHAHEGEGEGLVEEMEFRRG